MHKPCPCGSDKDFSRCCEPCLKGDIYAATAEQLMRSRYTAYVVGDESYLLSTWHSSTRPQQLHLESEPASQWIGLKVLASTSGEAHDSDGRVEFIARYKINGKAHRLHENSRFVKERGRWFYIDGTLKA